MSVKARIAQELDRLAAGGPPDSQVQRLAIDVDRGRLECELVALDTIGCAFRHLVFETDRLADVTADGLRQLGQSLASKLTYLLEPIGAMELDEQGFTLQLRSSPPHKDDDGTCYFELLARRGGEIRLCRYRKTPDQPRSIVPGKLTRETFLRLADDLAGAVESSA